MINEQKIRLFLSLAETLNFTETANQLFITQQAVSKHISQLEADLGFSLFVRSTHSVRLTAAGERCRVFFKEKLEEYTQFIADELEEQQRLNKSLRIGYNNWLNFGNAVVDARKRFSSLHPDIAHIPETQAPDMLLQKLRSNELDIIVVIRRFIQNESDLRILELADMQMSILVKKDMIPENGTLSLSELSSMPLLINSFFSESISETRARARREMKIVGLENKTIKITPNRDTVYISIETGEGVAISCMSSTAPEGIGHIPANCNDSLVCVCMESNKRKLVTTYMKMLQESFARQNQAFSVN